ncbi:hypothetical protein TTHERM_01285850 (macronuclear) [Tetrahymena thermophila SB210]|uniref:Uncharacterized protein n=1 Tax=Tetrahymena thermophila (strain SB210) TaxID=312017 RepID=Q22A50_TETTS|nr:hypothetical protein TTHERM_01285850 [Tetrahymena thermophila SB210]EAR82161.2 hypothetical protein TTHERM_01285850 [Tetrahymena thermophila SB210]|eukprot:XP_001029824.2 hypothetical protein TTHERM_01285850 [Tetrahymena thermophila SB210]
MSKIKSIHLLISYIEQYLFTVALGFSNQLNESFEKIVINNCCVGTQKILVLNQEGLPVIETTQMEVNRFLEKFKIQDLDGYLLRYLMSKCYHQQNDIVKRLIIKVITIHNQ